MIEAWIYVAKGSYLSPHTICACLQSLGRTVLIFKGFSLTGPRVAVIRAVPSYLAGLNDKGKYMPKFKVAVMASGGGTNLQQLLDRFPDREDSAASARVCLVVTNRPGIGALERASKAGVRSEVVPPSEFETPEAFGDHLIGLFREEAIDLVVLAGYLKKLPPNFIAAFQNRIINIHPALLPSFGGKGMYGHLVHEAVLASGVKVSGCTVHFVDERYDRGPIIAQRTVPVYHTDTAEILAARILKEEHQLLPQVVEMIAKGRVEVVGNLVHIHS